MEYEPNTYPEWVIPDHLTPVNVEETGDTYMVGHKFDHIRYYPMIDHYVLKVFDDELGLISMHIDGAMAGYISDETDVEISEFEHMTRTEYDAYVEAKANEIEGWLDD